MKVAITGGTGFIGELLVKKHIGLGDEVRVLTRNPKNNLDENAQLFNGDLINPNSLNGFLDNIDVLYHCAAEISDELKMNLVNVEGTKNLINCVLKKSMHWVQLSSVGVYGPIQSGIINENQPYNPVDEYEKTKLESDMLVIAASQKKDFTYTLIRPSNVFGENMRNTSLFQLIKSVDKGLFFFVGTPGASANYVAVENVVESLYLAATNLKAKNEVYNISSWLPMEAFIGAIAKELNKPLPKLRMSKHFLKIVAYITSFIPYNPLTVSRVNALSGNARYTIKKIELQLDYIPLQTIENEMINLVRCYKNRHGNV